MEEKPENKTLIQKLLASQEETIRTISHEIRNPLTLVYSTIQLIERQHPEVTGYRHWASLKEDTEYMQQLLNELSSYNNGNELAVSSFSISALLKQIAISYAASLVDTNIEFTSYIAPDEIKRSNSESPAQCHRCRQRHLFARHSQSFCFLRYNKQPNHS